MGIEKSTVAAKQDLRRRIRRSRRTRAQSPENPRHDSASRIADHVLNLEEIRHACAAGLPITCYLSRPDEPPTAELRSRLLAKRAVLLLPRIENDDLAWIRETPETTWVTNRWNIAEPTGPASDQAPGVWIIPGLAVDSDGYRLGQGGGYFDRALDAVHEDVPVIAIVFEDEVIEEVPREEHDRRVHIVVTPEGVLRL